MFNQIYISLRFNILRLLFCRKFCHFLQWIINTFNINFAFIFTFPRLIKYIFHSDLTYSASCFAVSFVIFCNGLYVTNTFNINFAFIFTFPRLIKYIFHSDFNILCLLFCRKFCHFLQWIICYKHI